MISYNKIHFVQFLFCASIDFPASEIWETLGNHQCVSSQFPSFLGVVLQKSTGKKTWTFSTSHEVPEKPNEAPDAPIRMLLLGCCRIFGCCQAPTSGCDYQWIRSGHGMPAMLCHGDLTLKAPRCRPPKNAKYFLSTRTRLYMLYMFFCIYAYIHVYTYCVYI